MKHEMPKLPKPPIGKMLLFVGGVVLANVVFWGGLIWLVIHLIHTYFG